MRKTVRAIVSFTIFFYLTGCSYNPFVSRHHETGSPAGILIGAAAGAGTVGLLGGSKSLMVLAGLGGGAIGYYVTTLRFASGGIVQAGGQVDQVGEYTTIYIPTDSLFETNTINFIPQAGEVLSSAVTVLKRQPNNYVLVSGHTSGFMSPGRERRLSRERARQVAFYLWRLGIAGPPELGNGLHKLGYVGRGDYFPLASRLSHHGIRTNSRIQILSYPAYLVEQSTTDIKPVERSNVSEGVFKD